ncbi:hypothetical protein EYF80_062956 [Liparis tanakae]|uniref:Uncharacterized protein n=1 Tax=Liparis tanakae TaxID=230148 RepID=A0A4Z2EF14_9TELE|nr:hypothetical protein EYF80_062956 [Liparis tanakae]
MKAEQQPGYESPGSTSVGFFWISSREGSRRCGEEPLSSGTPSKDGGLRMTSKAWPDARLFSSITSTSLMTHQPRSTASVWLEDDNPLQGMRCDGEGMTMRWRGNDDEMERMTMRWRGNDDEMERE